MQAQTITLRAISPAGSAPQVGPRLEPGAELVARLISAPENGGRGLIALAGLVLEAQLPAGLVPGQRLRLAVVHARPEELRVRVLHESTGADTERRTAGRLAGALAAHGDGTLLKVALHLADGAPLWLPGGVAAQVRVEPDAGEGEDPVVSGHGPDGEAAFVLHSPDLGAIEVRLRMAGGSVQAGVVTAPGEPARLAGEALGELVDALGRATGRPAAAAVAARTESDAPAPPEGAFDGYA